MELLNAFNQVIVLFILILLGYALRKLNIVDDSFSKNLSNFLFAFVFPCMIITSMDFPFSAEALFDSLWLVVISIAVMSFSGLAALFGAKLLGNDQASKNVFQYSITFPNFSYMGFPVVSALYGKEGLFYASTFAIVVRIVFYSVGILIMQRGYGKKTKFRLWDFVNPPLIAVAIGLLVFLFSIEMPKPVSMAMEMLAGVMSPMGMIIVGLILSNINIKKVFSSYKVYIVSFLRLAALPVILFIVLRQFELSPMLISVPVLITAMPVAGTVTVLAEKYNGNSNLGAQTVFISTLLSIVTIPLIVYMVSL